MGGPDIYIKYELREFIDKMMTDTKLPYDKVLEALDVELQERFKNLWIKDVSKLIW